MDENVKAPTLRLDITDEQWQEAREASSGGCLIADAIKKQKPHLSRVSVDMATIRATDSKKGLRYTWLTPQPAQELLLAFDQGWDQPTDKVTTQRASVITAVRIKSKARLEEVKAELAELDLKVEEGETLSTEEVATRKRLRKLSGYSDTAGKPKVRKHGSTVVGGRGLKQGPAHPNLLRGRNRIYGARSARPAEVFVKAVDAAVAEQVDAKLDAAVAAKLAELGVKA